MALPALWAGGGWIHHQLLGQLVAPWDKLVHMALFALVALALGAWLGIRRQRDLLNCLLITVLAGSVDEGLQHFDPERTVDADDLLANTVGALIGTGANALWWQWRVSTKVHGDDSVITRR